MTTGQILKVSEVQSLCGSPGSVAFCGHCARTDSPWIYFILRTPPTPLLPLSA